MAIKERKQITGTEAQIKGYAGHNGVLAYATDTKHLHVLSGTEGTTTELANRTDIPNVTGLQEAINSASTQASNAIPKSGNRGAIAGYEQWTKIEGTASATTLSVSSGDALLLESLGRAATINIQMGSVGQVATKLVWVSNCNKSITINGSVEWWAAGAPTLNKNNAVLLFFFHDSYAECKLIGQWD